MGYAWGDKEWLSQQAARCNTRIVPYGLGAILAELEGGEETAKKEGNQG